MTVFGWCRDGLHDACKHIAPVANGPVNWIECDCPCHQEDECPS